MHQCNAARVQSLAYGIAHAMHESFQRQRRLNGTIAAAATVHNGIDIVRTCINRLMFVDGHNDDFVYEIVRKGKRHGAAVPCNVEISRKVCDAGGQNVDTRVREFNVDREGHIVKCANVALQVRYFGGKHSGLNVKRLERSLQMMGTG